MGSNNFQQWNPTAANQKTDIQYTADVQRVDGAGTGVFPSTTANKLFYQTSIMAAALAQSMSDKGYAVSDDNFANLVAVLSKLVTQAEPQLLVPSGAVIPFAGAVAPVGWLLCYGQEESRFVYANLFSIIGITYGVGNGSSTFNLPDLRGRQAIGLDNLGGTAASKVVAATTLGQSGGVESQLHSHLTQDHTLTVDEMPSHRHGIGSYQNADGSVQGGSNPNGASNTYSTYVGGGLGHNHGNTTSTTISNMDPYIAMSYIIKY
jgi:microcystin-dependent protein